jgi:hypothetical protein
MTSFLGRGFDSRRLHQPRRRDALKLENELGRIRLKTIQTGGYPNRDTGQLKFAKSVAVSRPASSVKLAASMLSGCEKTTGAPDFCARTQRRPPEELRQ